MSLSTLPEDALARVCSHLFPSDRVRLRGVCSSLFHSLRPTNSQLWQDVHRYKYGLHTTPDRARRALQLCETADDYLCYTNAWSLVLRNPEHSNFASFHAPTNSLYAAASTRLIQSSLTDIPQITALLPGRATALTSCSSGVAVAWDRSVTVHARHSLRTTRPLRGHNSTVRSLTFLSNDSLLASGADDGSIRLHQVSTRRSQGVLRGHGGSVRQLREGGPAGGSGAALFSMASDRVKQWDIEMRRCTRTYHGRHCALSSDGGTVYVTAPGDSGAVRIYDARAPGVSAVLSLPRKWGSKRIEALAEENGAIAAAVGSGGVAYWRARGTWEAQPVGYPGWWGHDRRMLLKTILLRDGVAYAAGGVRQVIALGVEGEKPQMCVQPHEQAGGAYQQLLHAGEKRIVAVREDDVVLFDRRKKDVVMDEETARRTAGPIKGITGVHKVLMETQGKYPHAFKYGRFWNSNSDEEDEYQTASDRLDVT